jgi:hypothetical protein
MKKFILTTATICCGVFYASYAVAAGEVNWGGNAPKNDFFQTEISSYQPFGEYNANEYIGNDPFPSDYNNNNTGPMYAPSNSGSCYVWNGTSLVSVNCEEGAGYNNGGECWSTDDWDTAQRDEDCDGFIDDVDCDVNNWGPDTFSDNSSGNGCPEATKNVDPDNPLNCDNCEGVPVGSGIMTFLLGLGTYGLCIIHRNRKNQKNVINNLLSNYKNELI